MNLDLELVQLEAAELVRRGEDLEPTHLFKHALTQDAANNLLLIKQRRDLHRHAAQTYEELYAERAVFSPTKSARSSPFQTSERI